MIPDTSRLMCAAPDDRRPGRRSPALGFDAENMAVTQYCDTTMAISILQISVVRRTDDNPGPRQQNGWAVIRDIQNADVHRPAGCRFAKVMRCTSAACGEYGAWLAQQAMREGRAVASPPHGNRFGDLRHHHR